MRGEFMKIHTKVTF